MSNTKKRFLLLVFLLIFHSTVYAQVRDDDAIRAIIGEASNQGYTGMLSIACGIRNRGTLQGVYGLSAKHVDREPERVWNMARRAWQESKDKDITNGATHWENVNAFGKPYWADKMTKVFEHKDHIFYKERRKEICR